MLTHYFGFIRRNAQEVVTAQAQLILNGPAELNAQQTFAAFTRVIGHWLSTPPGEATFNYSVGEPNIADVASALDDNALLAALKGVGVTVQDVAVNADEPLTLPAGATYFSYDLPLNREIEEGEQLMAADAATNTASVSRPGINIQSLPVAVISATASQKDQLEDYAGTSYVLTGQSVMVDVEELRQLREDDPDEPTYNAAWQVLVEFGVTPEQLATLAYLHVV